jgi:carboxylesterase type B
MEIWIFLVLDFNTDRAFMMSGSFLPIAETTVTMKPVLDDVLKRTKCDIPQVQSHVECLRNLSAHELLEASVKTNQHFNTPLTTVFKPIIDDNFFRRQHIVSLQTGKFMKIPIMISTAPDEGTRD